MSYQKTQEINHDFADAHNNLGIVFFHKGQPDEAIEQYQKSLRIKPDVAEVYNNLGISLAQEGRVNEGIAQFQNALRLELIAKVAVGRVAFFRSLRQGEREGVMPQRISTEGATPPEASEKATRRAGVLLPCRFVARSLRSYGYAPCSAPRRKAKSLPARPVPTFAMSSKT